MHQYIREYRKKITVALIGVLFVGVVSIWYPILSTESKRILTVSFLDVGQGDAIFIETPSGRQILVDGGKDNRVLHQLNDAMPFWDRSIDVVVATHPDADHIGGLIEVLKRYRVDTFVHSGVAHDTEENTALASLVAEKDVRSVLAKRGQVYDFGDGTTITILFPDRPVSALESNAASIIAQVTFGKHSFLLTGDSPKMIEEYLLSLGGDQLQSTVLKVGHHGSKTSSSPLFVGFVAPEYAVLSRGCDNRYGHPHEEVIAVLNSFEIATFDTCDDGRVTFTSNGQILQIK
ncbi:MBL fold metallo-hydrolase [Candidatus Kaiserbacteria bacterium]|nr:MAG: MBL fold metallo-hydrolase [Candidatus Kaiserbacteria bacterium]